jgi:hypothetical protein
MVLEVPKREAKIVSPCPLGGEEELMAVCEVCGNDYDKAFEVRAEGTGHVFDSFECAIP